MAGNRNPAGANGGASETRHVKTDRPEDTRPIRAAQATATLRIVVIGGRLVGQLLSRGITGVEAFGLDDRSCGIFATATQAVEALAGKVRP
jgi:hypothetical protein